MGYLSLFDFFLLKLFACKVFAAHTQSDWCCGPVWKKGTDAAVEMKCLKAQCNALHSV